jgi:hypothetical protein
MPSTKTYPSLKTLLQPEQLPQGLGMLQNGIDQVLGRIFYKDLVINKSKKGDKSNYTFNLVTFDTLGIDIPGTGLKLLLNPSPQIIGTELPISFNFRFDILKYIQGFNLATFPSTPRDFFKLLIEIADPEENEFLKAVIDIFIEESEPINKWIYNFNNTHPQQQITVLPNNDENIYLNLIIDELDRKNIDIYDITYDDYIENLGSLNALTNIEDLFGEFLGMFSVDYLKTFLIPQVFASINGINVAIEFPRSIFIPINSTTGQELAGNSLLTFNVGSLMYSTKKGLEFIGENSFDFQKSKIFGTGFTIELIDLKLDLSKTKNIPEAIADGRPEDFIGVYITDSIITFPASWLPATGANASTGVIKGRNLLIGTGGISGTLSLEALNGTTISPLVNFTFGDFVLKLNSFSLTFQQNSITQSNIDGTLVFPEKYNQTKTIDGTLKTIRASMQVKVCILQNGDFKISAIDTSDVLKLEYEDIFILDITSLSAGRENDKFYVDMAAILKFNSTQAGLPDGILPKEIQINRCRVWENGKLDIAVSGLKLPHAFKINLGPMKLSVSNIHFGSHQQNNRSYNYFGFDGAVDFKPGGVEARGNGIKFYFNTDNGAPHRFLRVDGIGIDIQLPANAKSASEAEFLFKGYLGISNIPESNITEYSGSISFAIKKFSLQGGAAMRYQPDKPAFIVDLGIELGSPIPLGATGLGIYGFRGLFGQNYIPSPASAGLTPDDSYWKYYKAKKPENANPEWKKEGIHAGKFAPENGNSFGAGLSLATSFDGGRTLSTKLFALMGVPGGLMVQGQASILAKRLGLTDPQDPPFSALLVINNKQVSADLGIHYTLPNEPDSGEPSDSKGSILDLKAHAEMAYFFKDSKAWYVNLGKDQPEDARIKARILSLFDGYSYLMLSAKGIKLGAGAGFDFNAKYGPVSVGAGLYIATSGMVNFRPSQIGGLAQAGGYAYVKVFKFKMGLQIDVSLGAEVPKPFIIEGKVNVSIDLPRPLRDIQFDFELKWVKTRELNNLPLPVIEIKDEKRFPAKAINIMAGESFEVFVHEYSAADFLNNPDTAVSQIRDNLKNFENSSYVELIDKYTIPLDSYIDIDFSRGVARNNNLPIGDVVSDVLQFTETVPAMAPRPENVVQHEFRLIDFKILYYDPVANNWKPYNIYTNNSTLNSLVNQLVTDGKISNINQLFSAFWQKVEKDSNKRIRVLAQQPFSYTQLGSPGSMILEHQGFNLQEIFCGKGNRTLKEINWLDQDLGVVLVPNGFFSTFKNVQFKWFTDQGYEVVASNLTVGSKSFNKACEFDLLSGFEIYFGEAINKLEVIWEKNWQSFSGFILHYSIELFDNANNFITKLQSEIHQIGAPSFLIQRSELSNLSGFRRLKFKIENIEPEASNPKVNTSDLIIGKASNLDNFLFGAIPGVSNHLNGWISDIKLIKGVLTEEEIFDFFNGNNTLPNQQDLLLSYSLNNNLNPEVNNLTNGPSSQIVDENNLMPLFEDYQPLDSSSELSLATGQDNYYSVDHHDDIAFDWESFSIILSIGLKEENPQNSYYQVLIDKRTISGTNVLGGYSLVLFENQLQFHFVDPLNGALNLTFMDNELQYGCKYQICASVNREKGLLYLYLSDVEGNRTYVKESNLIFGKPSGMNLGVKLYELNYETVANEQYNQAIISPETLESNLNIMKQAYNGLLQPIWRPETLFAIELKTRDTVYPSNQNTNDSTTTILFKTRGPIGNFHLHNSTYSKLVTKDALNEFKFENLQHYVDVINSYPNPEGKLNNVKPIHFEEPKLNLVFNHEYVKLMFENWNSITGLPSVSSRLKLEIVELLAEVAPSEITQDWVNDETKLKTEHDEMVLFNTINKHISSSVLQLDCEGVSIGTLEKNSYNFNAQLPNLKPKTLYQAIYSLQYGPANEITPVILKYNFMTSRYSSLSNQLGSYKIDEDTYNNLPTLAGNLDMNEMSKAYDAIKFNTFEDSLKAKFSDKFSRTIEGLLGINVFNIPAIGTEVCKIVNTHNGGEILIGLLIRSDEPFYEPKLLNDIQELLNFRAKTNENDSFVPQSFRVIASNDLCQIFITKLEGQDADAQRSIGLDYYAIELSFNNFNYTSNIIGEDSSILIINNI